MESKEEEGFYFPDFESSEACKMNKTNGLV
jgi:hypothetical protein